jgi:hypothetical protein
MQIHDLAVKRGELRDIFPAVTSGEQGIDRLALGWAPGAVHL